MSTFGNFKQIRLEFRLVSAVPLPDAIVSYIKPEVACSEDFDKDSSPAVFFSRSLLLPPHPFPTSLPVLGKFSRQGNARKSRPSNPLPW